jgi:hypothetical protein
LPFSSTAPFVTQDPAAQLFTFELKVNVCGNVQSPIMPMAHVTLFAATVAVPPDFPTTVTVFMQAGTLSVTVTFSDDILETTRFLNAADPWFAWNPNPPDLYVPRSGSVVVNCHPAGSNVPATQVFARIVVPQVRTLMLYHVFLATQSMVAI